MARLVWARNQPMVSRYGTVPRLHLMYILHASSDCCADDEQTLFHQLSRLSWLPEMSRYSPFPSFDTTLHNHLFESRHVQDMMPPWSFHQLPGFHQAGAGLDAVRASIVTVVPDLISPACTRDVTTDTHSTKATAAHNNSTEK